jgi:hypothetical protein
MDWNAFEAVATAVGVLVAIIPLILQWRRQAPAAASPKIRSESSGVLRELSSNELQLLRHVHALSAKLAVLEMRFPLNSPMNTPNGNEAKCGLVRQLHETELMKEVGVEALCTFRAFGQNLQRLRLVDYEPLDAPWGSSGWSMSITELGAMAVSDGLPQPAAAGT